MLNSSEHAELVISAVNNRAVTALHIDEHIKRSWSRCVNDHHLDPMGVHKPVIITHRELKERQEAQQEFLLAGKSELSTLYAQLPSSGYCVLLTDAEGVVLSYSGDPALSVNLSSTGLMAGAHWAEQYQGTNGLGTVLVEKQPLVIRRNEHFLSRNTALTCAASPIFDETGQVIAILDISTFAMEPKQNTLQLASMSAQVIENRLFLERFKDKRILRFHSRPELVGILGEGYIALAEDGTILAANRNALFHLNYQQPDQLAGQNVTELFNLSLAAIEGRNNAAGPPPHPIYEAQQGSQFFAVIQTPATALPRGYAGLRPVAGIATESSHDHPFEFMHFGDAKMADNIRLVTRVLDLDLPILLHGETGTGKEVFAKAIHAARDAKGNRPFVAVNCASLPEALIESELFGYRQGAFTGANREGRRGKILQANGGTLFLDEIGDMPLQLQARLLRVLEEREVTPLGSETPIKVDIHLVSATHCDLPKLVEQGQFREDLYYRLRGIIVELPALRNRQDKENLIRHLFAQENRHGTPLEIDPAAIQLMANYHWPGNIRQLRSVIRAALALREGPFVTALDLPAEITNGQDRWWDKLLPQSAEMEQVNGMNVLQSAERQALIKELENNYWNITKLAKQLNISRNTLYRKIRLFNIKCPK